MGRADKCESSKAKEKLMEGYQKGEGENTCVRARKREAAETGEMRDVRTRESVWGNSDRKERKLGIAQGKKREKER